MLFLPPVHLSWIVADVLQVIVILILIDVIRSWLFVAGVRNTSEYAPWVRSLHRVIDPILTPFRMLWDAIVTALGRAFRTSTYSLRRFDLSPMLAIIVIQVVENLLWRAAI